MYNPRNLRYQKTLDFIKKHLPEKSKIIDLGTKNEFSEILQDNNYNVINSLGEDLDFEYDIVKKDGVDAVTAFEIFEHMLCPLHLLISIKANKLIASVPLKLWFSAAYWGKDEWDRHYHEFEVKQFNMLLEKSGWEIIKSEKWTSPSFRIGIRPILRRFVPRYYIVYCERKK